MTPRAWWTVGRIVAAAAAIAFAVATHAATLSGHTHMAGQFFGLALLAGAVVALMGTHDDPDNGGRPA